MTIHIKEVFYAHLSVHHNHLKAFPATSQSLTSNSWLTAACILGTASTDFNQG